MAKHRSISQRMERAGSKQVRDEIAHEWAQAWQDDHDRVIRQLEKGVSQDDYDQTCIALGQLKELSQKRFQGLRTVIEKLSKNHGQD